jgi:hypothetical protein
MTPEQATQFSATYLGLSLVCHGIALGVLFLRAHLKNSKPT